MLQIDGHDEDNRDGRPSLEEAGRWATILDEGMKWVTGRQSLKDVFKGGMES